MKINIYIHIYFFFGEGGATTVAHRFLALEQPRWIPLSPRVLPSASWTCSGPWIHPDELLRTCLPLLLWREIISPAIKLSFPVTLCLHFYERCLPIPGPVLPTHGFLLWEYLQWAIVLYFFCLSFLLTYLFFPPPTAWKIFHPLKKKNKTLCQSPSQGLSCIYCTGVLCSLGPRLPCNAMDWSVSKCLCMSQLSYSG